MPNRPTPRRRRRRLPDRTTIFRVALALAVAMRIKSVLGRRSLPSHLKRERIEHDLTEEEKHCASCELANVDPFAWFQDVRSRIGAHSSQHLDELLPHRWAAARTVN